MNPPTAMGEAERRQQALEVPGQVSTIEPCLVPLADLLRGEQAGVPGEDVDTLAAPVAAEERFGKRREILHIVDVAGRGEQRDQGCALGVEQGRTTPAARNLQDVIIAARGGKVGVRHLARSEATEQRVLSPL